ncbi:MAG TPA: glycosyltransferase [Thermoplasmata archaeon]|jgi:glycosyltransferase involved in cell wall biosynthesis|nr:glycosyltransferase [Thermoplasmata archaeon]
MPRVSVIVPTLDEAKYLPHLLDSLRRQTVQDLEVLVADSGSTDGTAEVAAGWGARVLPGERKGPGEGRNRGAKAAKGTLFLFSDADCVAPPELIETILAALEDPRVIGGATMFMPQDGTALDRLLFGFANAYQRAMTELGFPHNAGYCFFFRREAFEALGGIREDMLLNETHDLALRSRAVGRFVVLPVVVRTSMRRFRTYGYARTIVREYIASTLLYYLTGRTPADKFRPKPAR